MFKRNKLAIARRFADEFRTGVGQPASDGGNCQHLPVAASAGCCAARSQRRSQPQHLRPAAGSLPELTTLIKQNGAAVVNISVEGKSSEGMGAACQKVYHQNWNAFSGVCRHGGAKITPHPSHGFRLRHFG